jgi:hypothetical protein
MGDSKITIYRLYTDCNKSKFDTTSTVVLIFNNKNLIIDSISKRFSVFKNFQYDSFHYKYSLDDKLLEKAHYWVNDSTKNIMLFEKFKLKYINDSCTIDYYFTSKINSKSIYTRIGSDSISLNKYIGYANTSKTLTDSFSCYYYFNNKNKLPDSMIYGLWNLPKNEFYAKYQIATFSKFGDTLIITSSRYDNKKLSSQITQVNNSNYLLYKNKYFDVSGDFHQYKDSTIFKSGKITSIFNFKCDVNTNNFSVGGKYVYHYINTKINYIDYFDYYDASCTRLSRYKYLYDTVINTPVDLDKSSAKTSIEIYPNPIFQNETGIRFNTILSTCIYKIYSVSGKTILEGSISNTKEIALPFQLSKGLYFIELQNVQNGNGTHLKLIVQ